MGIWEAMKSWSPKTWSLTDLATTATTRGTRETHPSWPTFVKHRHQPFLQFITHQSLKCWRIPRIGKQVQIGNYSCWHFKRDSIHSIHSNWVLGSQWKSMVITHVHWKLPWKWSSRRRCRGPLASSMAPEFCTIPVEFLVLSWNAWHSGVAWLSFDGLVLHWDVQLIHIASLHQFTTN